mgnify:CR=1 FL=1
MNSRKTFILDTSVLLYDKCAIHSFPNGDVVLPLVVLDELDRFKEKPGILGESARYVNRYLDTLRGMGSLHEGVKIENNQTIRVESDRSDKIPKDLNEHGGDNRVIGVARYLKETSDNSHTVTVITKDINFRVKCDALLIESEDYYKDRIVTDRNELYSGYKSIELSNPDLINKFYSDGKIPVDDLDISLSKNEFIIIKHQKQSLLGVEKDGSVCELECYLHDMVPIHPRNKEQKFSLDLLTRDDIPLVTLTGIAGSGKTFLTLLTGIAGIQDGRYDRIVITRTLQPVGRSIGYLPGDIDDKLDPWIGSVTDNIRQHFRDLTYFEMMRKKGKVEIVPLAFIRGRTFNNTFLIVDEAQNSTIHELKTIITRVGENSKIVLLGDIEQIDTPYIDSLSNGLTIVIEKMKNESLAGHVTLRKGERSEIATLASKLI